MKFELKQEVYDELKEICFGVYKSRENISVTEMLIKLFDSESMIMHCPYHHFTMPAALLTLTAIDEGKTAGELREWLDKAEERGRSVPGGFCGECGTCGAAVGVGIFVSIYTGATPKTVENWQWANEVTGRCLVKIASYPGPRCCKRVSFLALEEGLPYVNGKCGLNLRYDTNLKCKYHNKNTECLEGKCLYYEKEES